MIQTAKKTKSTELPPGWQWHYRDPKARSFIAEKPGSEIRSPGFPDEAAAAHWARMKDESLREDGVIAEAPTLEKALHSALHSVQGAAERWQPLQESGAADNELMETVRCEWGLGGGSTAHGGYKYRGGKSPQFLWESDGDSSKTRMLTGKRLLAKVREVLEIGAPGARAEREEEEITPAEREQLRQSALARWRREPAKLPESPECVCGDSEAAHDGPGGVCGLADCNCCGFVPAIEAGELPSGTDLVKQAFTGVFCGECDGQNGHLPSCSRYAPATNGHHPDLRLIPLDQIVRSLTNPRKYFDPVKLQELADSIEAHGLAQPILVRPRPAPGRSQAQQDVAEAFGIQGEEYFEIVAGERRWRAAKLTKLGEIPAVVRQLDDKAVLEIQFIENLQRTDLSPIEEADGYKRLLDEHGYTADSLAGKLGKSKSYVYARLKLCNLPEAAMEALAKGDLPATVGELIGRLPSMEMREQLWEDNYGDIGSDWFDPPSFRDIKAQIERGYMRELKSAPFSQADKKLLPDACSCKDCPKRTGNNKVEYPDSRADICTDTGCYDRKVEAFNKRKLAEAAKGDGVKVLSQEDSEKWFNGVWLTDDKERQWVDLSEECHEAVSDDSDDDEVMPTYGDLLGDSVKPEIVAMDRHGKIHQLVHRQTAEPLLSEKGIKPLASREFDRKADQQKHKEEKQIRDQAANEICDRVIQSLTDKPLTLEGRSDWDDFLRAIALHLVSDADIARYVAKRHALGNGDHRAALHKLISDRSGQGTLELIVEYLIAEELEWWIRSGEPPWPLKHFPISEYFGHDPRKIEKRITKEHAAAKKAKPKAKAAAKA